MNKPPLPIELWTTKAHTHFTLVGPMVDAFLKRREIGLKHPVHDFLFIYYNCSPQKLKQWIPSFEETLQMDANTHSKYPWFTDHWFEKNTDLLFLKKERITTSVKGLAQFVAELCQSILERAPRFGCFGLHEWAMVYKMSPEDLRHQGYSLRLSVNALASFVESQSICCSHYDAFRFFTKEARPLNVLNPSLDNRLEMEQSGCLHANMDLYKWSIKLWPWIGSDFIAKAFFLALKGRELDMRASPYDLKEMGYLPICIETEEGRKEYVKEQKLLTELATPLRQELHTFCLKLIS